jgi:hypothetical protein
MESGRGGDGVGVCFFSSLREFVAQLKSSVFSFVESANRTKPKLEHLQNYPGGNSAQESFVYLKKVLQEEEKVFLTI